ncbi:MAG: FAD-dependent oxidoreductase [Verrucomicrobia bacterium]|nr:MAG: FAD-dependent oxidoreductase [Verrucomicrobiota bacterium]
MQIPGERAGENISFWERTAKKFYSSSLSENLTADVCVVGGGIAGVTTAYLLARENRRVVLLDDGPVGGGMTGRTTAHLVSALDDRYYEFDKILGKECSRFCAESHTAAIDRMEAIVSEEKIDCAFERVDGYLFLPPGGSVADLERELESVLRAGLRDVERVDRIPTGKFNTNGVLRFPRQAQFHPLNYVNGLARAILKHGGQIFTGTRVVKIQDGDRTKIETSNRHTITAGAAVVATNCPINDRLAIHSKQAPYGTYVIGARVTGKVEHALFWDTAMTADDEKQILGPVAYHYVRFARDEEGEVLIVGGEDHKSGQAEDFERRFSQLEHWSREHFPMLGEITDRWSGQVMEPVDGVAYIGRNPGEKNVYVVTGDSGNGMTHGTIAGILITDLIAGRENPWVKLYEPTRKTLKPVVIADYIAENANVAVQLRDYVTSGDEPNAEKIKPREGAILRDGLKKIAAYRDDKGTLHTFSAVCPHLKCIVRWDGAEQTWDCPCHGSRFDRLGRVLNGPAISDLEPHRNQK